MDLYEDQVDLDHQVHDYNPGIPPSGLFWVTRIPEDAVEFHLGSGKASMDVEDLALSDYGNILHALLDENEVPAEISFSARWKNVIQQVDLHDAENSFEGHFVENQAFVEWTASQDGFEFESDPMEMSESTFAVIGKERNGVFFS
jgi:hypothetical protein